jgi:hypothetical protein
MEIRRNELNTVASGEKCAEASPPLAIFKTVQTDSSTPENSTKKQRIPSFLPYAMRFQMKFGVSAKTQFAVPHYKKWRSDIVRWMGQSMGKITALGDRKTLAARPLGEPLNPSSASNSKGSIQCVCPKIPDRPFPKV